VHDVGKLGSHMLLYNLNANVLTISELRRGMLLGLRYLLRSMRDRAYPSSGRAKRLARVTS
jgi:hypothetical protein